MKERPIIFNGEMVRALLEGRKTQTRRAVKPSVEELIRCHAGDPGDECEVSFLHGTWLDDDRKEHGPEWLCYADECPEEGVIPIGQCPYGQPGDRLWVREGFRNRRVDGQPGEVTYRADHPGATSVPDSYGRPWKPSIHMPRWASRITLEVTSVRVERLQEISEADAEDEGAFFTDYGRRCHHYGPPRDASECPEPDEHHPQRAGWSMVPTDSHEQCLVSPRWAFANLWESINGAGSWDLNPWVWVVEFKRLGEGS